MKPMTDPGDDGLRRLVPDTEGLRAVWGKRPALFTGGSPIVEVFSLSHLDEVVGAGAIRYPFVGLIGASGRIPQSAFTRTRRAAGRSMAGFVDAAAVWEAIAGGATVVLDSLEIWHVNVWQLTKDWSGVLGCTPRVTAFVSPAGAQALPPHLDSDDSLIVQVEGEKQWTVYDRPYPLAYEAPGPVPEPGRPLLKTVLEPGEVLHVPAGFPHRARAADTYSLHLTFGVARPTRDQILRAVAGSLLDETDISKTDDIDDLAHDLVAVLRTAIGRAEPHAIAQAIRAILHEDDDLAADERLVSDSLRAGQ